MGDSAPQPNARSLREVLVGLNRFEQHIAAAQWAIANNKVIDMFGKFASERNLLLFRSGNECENWIDPILHMVYKMNMLVHVGEDILKLLDRIDLYNKLFPEVALTFIGIQIMSKTNVYPVFAQPFVDNAEFATITEINEYMQSRGFAPTGQKEGQFSNGTYILSDIRPKNVLRTSDGTIFVIDAEISLCSKH
ncbi:MAG: hypothetical protein MJ003_00445 [Paludibacteraceae bacterium]|nr:hypothetical protein [Paludibacteraceae bacterium]